MISELALKIRLVTACVTYITFVWLAFLQAGFLALLTLCLQPFCIRNGPSLGGWDAEQSHPAMLQVRFVLPAKWKQNRKKRIQRDLYSEMNFNHVGKTDVTNMYSFQRDEAEENLLLFWVISREGF